MKQSANVKWVIDGVESEIFVEQYNAIYPYHHTVTRIVAEPTEYGKTSKSYKDMRNQLGDDWITDLTNSWFDVKYPHHMVVAVDNIIKELNQ